MLGFELVSAGSKEMKNPGRDVPVAILVSGTIIIVMYTLATVAILAAIPAADINLVEGLVDTLELFFGVTVPEIMNRSTITGGIEIGRHPGIVTVFDFGEAEGRMSTVSLPVTGSIFCWLVSAPTPKLRS